MGSELADVYGPIQSPYDVEEMISKMLVLVMDKVPCRAGSIIEIDYEQGDLFFRASVGSRADELRNFRIPRDAGIVGHVLRTQTLYRTQSLVTDPFHIGSMSRTIGFDVTDILACPIYAFSQPYGVLELFNRVPAGGFSDEDCACIQALVNEMTQFIEKGLTRYWELAA